MAERAQLRVLRHELDRHVRTRTSATPSPSSGTSRTSRRSPTGCSRASSTSSSSAALMIHAAGLRRPTPRSRLGTPARPGPRPARPLLRRQQPGRHHRRRRHRGRPGLDPGGARRAGHELQHPAATAASDFDTYSARSSSPPTPTRSTASSVLVAHPDAVGPGRDQRLRPPHDRRPVPGHARPTRCCCTSPSATTRWPTSRPRSRPARSARPPASRRWRPGAARRRAVLGHPRHPVATPTTGRRSSTGTAATRRRRPTNIPPRDGEDPHEKPRRQPPAQAQKSEFLRTDGTVVDTCGGTPCLAP